MNDHEMSWKSISTELSKHSLQSKVIQSLWYLRSSTIIKVYSMYYTIYESLAKFPILTCWC